MGDWQEAFNQKNNYGANFDNSDFSCLVSIVNCIPIWDK